MARPEDNGVARPGDNDAAMKARLERLSGEIQAQREETAGPPRSESRSAVGGGLSTGMNMAFRMVTEIVAGICGGGFLGWLLDRWLHTQPIFLIVLGLLGTAGGFWNIVRSTMTAGRAKSVDFPDRLGATRRDAEHGDR